MTVKSPGSRLEVLKAISDAKSLMLLTSIAKGQYSDRGFNLTKGLFSHKEYYSRIGKFIKTGLVIRKEGKCFLTPFGEVINEIQLLLAQEINRNRTN